MNDKTDAEHDTATRTDGAPFAGDPPPMDHAFDDERISLSDIETLHSSEETDSGNVKNVRGKDSSGMWDFEPDPRALVRWLKKLRRRRGFDKHDFAGRLGCELRTLSMIEKGYDRDLSVVHVANYVEALNMRCVLQIIDEDMTDALDLQSTLIETERWLSRLYRLFERTGDKQAMREVERFICQTLTTPIVDSYIFGDANAESSTGVLRVELSPSI